jgi:hypothetical protein
MSVVVSTTCPFCGGSAPLLNADDEVETLEIIERFRGFRVTCPHRGCEKPYAVRRGDVRIWRE